MPQAPRKTSVAQSEIPTAIRNLIGVYLAVSVGAIALLLFGSDPSSGIFLVLFALPWSLFVNQISGLIGIDSAALNLALLAIGVGINGALLYLLGRRLRRRQ